MTRTIVALALFAAAPSAMAYSLASSFTSRSMMGHRAFGKSSLTMETFGFSFAEDGAAFVPDEILGEARLKNTYVPGLAKAGVVERPFLSEDYPVLTRVAELGLLSKTADAGILTALTEKGLTLSQLEKILPVLDDLGLLTTAVENKQIILNLVVPLLIEPAPLLLAPLAALIKSGGAPFTAISLVSAALAVAPVTSGDEPSIPLFILAVLTGGLGTVFAGKLPIPEPSNTPFVAVSSPTAAPTAAPSLPSFGGGGGRKGLRI